MSKKEKKIENKESKVSMLPTAPTTAPSVMLRNEIDKAREKLKVEGADPTLFTLPTIPPILDDSDLALSTILNRKPSSLKQQIKDNIKTAWESLIAQLQAKIEALPETLEADAIAMLFGIIDLAVDTFVVPIDSIYLQVLYSYNQVIQLVNKLIYAGSNAKKKLEEKKKHKEELKELRNTLSSDEIEKLEISEDEKKEMRKEKAKEMLIDIASQNPYVGDVIAVIFLVQSMKHTIQTITDIKQLDPDNVNDNINELDTLHELFNQEALLGSQIISTIVNILGILSQLILLIGAINAGSKKENEEYSIVSTEQLQQENTPRQIISYGSLIVEQATNDENGLTYNNDSSTDSEPEEEDASVCLDITKLCDYEELPDAIDTTNTKNRLLFEFDKSYHSEISVSPGNEIRMTDELGRLDNMPVSPQMHLSIDEVNGNIVKAKYLEDDIEELNSLIESLYTNIDTNPENEYSGVVDKFNELNQIENLILYQLAYLKYPYIPINEPKGDNTEITTHTAHNVINRYEKHIKNISDEYIDDMSELTSDKHCRELLKDERIEDLKNEILNRRSKFNNDIFNAFDTYLINNALFVSSDSMTSSYYLLSQYMDLYSTIDYDKDNKYTIELADILTSFISDRTSLESKNVEYLLDDFNKYCNKYIEKFWTFNVPYYDKMNSLFTSPATDIVTSIGEKNGTYQKLYDFLEALTGYHMPESNINVNVNNMDMNSFDINTTMEHEETTEDDRNMMENVDALKKICMKFILIQNVLTNNSDNQAMTSETEDTNEAGIKERLKLQCNKEVDRISLFYDKVKSKYYEYATLYTGDCFKQFDKVKIIRMPNVFYNGEEFDHYFITKQEKVNAPHIVDKAVADLDMSPETEATPFTMKYWLRYCGIASLTHCALYPYWGCGIIINGAPIQFPVIYIPIYYLDDRVGILFGIGICGLAIYPMIVPINFTEDVASILFPLNAIIGMMTTILSSMKNLATEGYKESLKKLIDKKQEQLKENNDIERLQIKLNDMEEDMTGFGHIKDELKRRSSDKKRLKEISSASSISIISLK